MSSDTQGEPTPIYEYLTPEQSLEGEAGPSQQGWLVAIDYDTIDRPLADHRLVLCPATGGARFTVFRCTDATSIPDGACLQRSLDTTVIVEDDYKYNVIKAALVDPESAGSVPPARLLTVPEEFQDSVIVESEATNRHLWNVLTTADQLDKRDGGPSVRTDGELPPPLPPRRE
jgi:hypothetical protein